jgi:DNA-binding transcriptional MerR regulator
VPTDTEYTLTELATLAGVTPRTVRYYISVGLLPSPGQVGPGTRYGEGHLQRVRLIRRLQAEHLPLAEIRDRLAGLDDGAVSLALAEPPVRSSTESALDYIRALKAGSREASGPAEASGPPDTLPALYRRSLQAKTPASPPAPGPGPRSGDPAGLQAPGPGPRSVESAGSVASTRSQWERVSLTPDIELHIRRPLSRLENKRVERLITIAREVLREDER